MIKAVIFDLTGVLINLKREGDFEIIESSFDFAKNIQKRYKMGILSNLPADYREKLQERGFCEIFDIISLSGETGYTKPQKEAYLSILRELSVVPEESIFIDDSAINIKAAKKLGMKTFLFKEEDSSVLELRKLLSFF